MTVQMRLAEFIRANAAQLLHEWEDFARKLTGESPLPKWLLRDHAALIIGRIADALQLHDAAPGEPLKADSAQLPDPTKHPTLAHVELRIESGFDLLQIMAEYFALRSCVVRLWRDRDPDGFANGAAEIARFAELIDENVAAAVSHYKERETRYRDRFLGILGHDLRNPINAILLNATSLATRGSGDEQLRTISHILNSARRLSKMVDDLLDFARGRLGAPMMVKPVPADLGKLVDEIVTEVQSAYPRSVIDFVSNGDLVGKWDVPRLKQMIANLLLNAIQHGADQTIAIAIKAKDDSLSLEVHNEGPPIPPELLPTIFDPLVRGSHSDENDSSLGLGLFIVSQIVAAHHGTITVTSSEGAGTTFIVNLPRKSS